MGKIKEAVGSQADQIAKEFPLFADIRTAEPEFASALAGTGLNPAQFVTNAINQISMDMLRPDPGTKIIECQPESVIGALLNCAQMGLRPGPFDEAWIIPRARKAEFHANYKALRRLALEHPEVHRITAQLVRTEDDFDVLEGTENYLRFKPKLLPNKDRGKVRIFFALAKMANGEHQFVWWHTNDMATFRNQFGSKSKSSPWYDASGYGYNRMGLKTVLLRLLDELPRSPKVSELIAADGTVRTDLNPAKRGYEVGEREDTDVDPEPVDLDDLSEPETDPAPAGND